MRKEGVGSERQRTLTRVEKLEARGERAAVNKTRTAQHSTHSTAPGRRPYKVLTRFTVPQKASVTVETPQPLEAFIEPSVTHKAVSEPQEQQRAQRTGADVRYP